MGTQLKIGNTPLKKLINSNKKLIKPMKCCVIDGLGFKKKKKKLMEAPPGPPIEKISRES